MENVFNRIVELIGWIVLGVSSLLLVIAHHIDNYQSPPAVDAARTTPLAK
ncbi:division septum protein Blr [Klebsiella indica]|uniref:Division septum protein Blr n=1 Tax=Klebsiella indica TaxID=2582917 RepID=A0A5R9LP30_9ENTR|nr:MULTISPECIES: division septum protein Blr [Klebsiella]TLV23041.1 division septum protein Blr [Klebsiella indica]